MSDVVRDYYDNHVPREWGRLEAPLCRLEFASTLRLIEKYFPGSGAICDIGGGPGRYAMELVRRGFRVTLVDLSTGLLKRAEIALREAGLAADALIPADACDLSVLRDARFDAALSLGPLYHLVERSRRMAALRELRRLLRPGAPAIVAYLNSWGILRCGIGDFPERYADVEFALSMLREKTFVGSLPGFTESHWTTPEIALREVAAAGFDVLGYAGAGGFAGGMRPMIEEIAVRAPDTMPTLEVLAAQTCELAQYRDATEHLHIVIRRP